MKLQLISTRVESLELLENNDLGSLADGFNLKFANAYSEEDSHTFQVIFEMELGLNSNKQVNVKYTATFELDEPIDDKFRDSHWPSVNAPAIAYPFARSFIGTFLLNAGYEPIMLPSVNFSAINQKSQNK